MGNKYPIPLFKVFMSPDAHAALAPVLSGGQLATGQRVAAFEAALATRLGADAALALNDASGALTLALYLAGVRPGDEVITSPLACAASLMPIANLFARPVWCDVDPATGMPDARCLDALYSPQTRAILVYHWSGNVADMAALRQWADARHIPLIQDATEAWGAEFGDNRLWREADYTVYSFYATKHVNCGEGGALLARNTEQLAMAKRLRRFGIDYAQLRLPNGDLNARFDIPVAGFNLAMNELAATLGLASLEHVGEIESRYRANGAFYEQALANVPGVTRLRQQAGTTSGWWTYSLLAERRDDLIAKLHSAGIGAQRLHLRHDAYSCFASLPSRPLPGVTSFDAANISLPCGWWVTEQDRERVANCVREGW